MKYYINTSYIERKGNKKEIKKTKLLCKGIYSFLNPNYEFIHYNIDVYFLDKIVINIQYTQVI